MTFFPFLHRQPVRPTRTFRALRLAVEGFERRRLMSGATIAGTVLTDLTGNGSSSDDTPLAGVTIDLYKKGSTTVLESITTGQDGSYRFTDLSSGSYSVQQVTPSKSLATVGIGGYSIALKSGQTIANQNFDDFHLLPQPALSGLRYTVITPGGKSSTVSSLDGDVQQGDKVTATFDLKTPEVVTLVAYEAPNNDFDTKNLQEQVIVSQARTSGTSGEKSLTVTVPDGYFQIDFVAGPAIDHLAVNSNVMYHAQDRFIDGDHGGSHAVVSHTNPPDTAQLVPGDPVASPPVTPVVTTLSADTTVASPEISQARKH